MLSYDRRQAILEYIRQQQSASVTELSKQFFISETSIRRDLQKLERAGLIHKTYGGAVLVQGNNEVISLEARQQVEREAKLIIAKRAAQMVQNGDVVFLDSSSTALAMVPFLSGLTSLSVITNGLRIANALTESPQFKVYVLGGLLNARTFSMRGALTCQMLDGMYANRLFVSPKGVDENGCVYCADEEEAFARKKMMSLSDKTVLLCNQKKLGEHGAFKLCDLSRVNAIVLDAPAPEKWMALMKENAVTIL